jgi:hypothetical protein
MRLVCELLFLNEISVDSVVVCERKFFSWSQFTGAAVVEPADDPTGARGKVGSERKKIKPKPTPTIRHPAAAKNQIEGLRFLGRRCFRADTIASASTANRV